MPPHEDGRDVWGKVFPRLLFMIGFGFVLYFSLWVVSAIALFQLIVILVNKDENPDLARFAKSLATYLWEVVAYVTWVREERPFPFGAWPQPEDRVP